jgi:hemerythrin superfamily protein
MAKNNPQRVLCEIKTNKDIEETDSIKVEHFVVLSLRTLKNKQLKLVIERKIIRAFKGGFRDGQVITETKQVKSIKMDEATVDALLDGLILAKEYTRGNVSSIV